ncbi:helix-turn-helix domain-containing protein [Cupriavidus gilardii]|uniref:helix-turn-helix domain-containing protein n=1 Tax=Cupriavidus gilardii TaxID=82541 RepID=UPI001ABDB204|nr:helix-turn-helix domain-containing protein [Cupriavidus gilardii]MBO4120887.1 helix-turn-helix domain-containing protein [Cupriavidus gilardii]
MKISSRYKEAFQRARQSHEYWTERALLELSRQLVEQMKKSGLTQKALAERLDKKPSFLSRLFGGNHNVTIATASEVAHALQMHLEIKLEPHSAASRKPSFSVTELGDACVPREGVVVHSRRLKLVKGANDSVTYKAAA